jgi:group I intron endonuclease
MYLPEKIDNNCGIYRIKNMRTGKFYIGSSKNLKGRKRTHFNELKKGVHSSQHLQRSWNKEIDKSVFEFHVFIYCKSDDLIDVEQKCIDLMNPSYNSNRTAGKPPVHFGDNNPMVKNPEKSSFFGKPAWNKNLPKDKQPHFGRKFSEDHLSKLRSAKLGRPSWNLGKELTEEHKKNLKFSHLNRKKGCHNVAKLKESDVLEILKSEESLSILAERYGVKTAPISAILRNLTWKYIPREKIWTISEIRARGWSAEKRKMHSVATANANENMTAEQRSQRSRYAAITRRKNKESALQAEAEKTSDWPSEVNKSPEVSASRKG